MLRRLTLSILFLVCLGIGIPTVPVLNKAFGPVIGIEQAQAQQKKKRKTLFDVLFKRRKKKTKIKVLKPRKKLRVTKKSRKKKRTVSRKAKAKAKPTVIVVKNENATKILVVGDFLAGGMAKELQKLYAANANVIVINKSNASSGLVRDDVVNWPESIPSLIEEFKPGAIVALVGMNDRQKLLRIPGKPEKLSPEWLTEYNNRAAKIASVSITNKPPLVWVGLPPVRSSKMNADYLAFNEVYRSNVEASGSGEYVDIWDGFTNEEGKFVSAGPDINGQIVRLRGSKGINMTRAGRAKLAFFADKALQKIGVIRNADGLKYASFGTINPSIAQPNIPQYDPASTGKTIIIPLGSPALDGGDILEGAEDIPASKNNESSVSYSLVEKGEIYAPQSGRIDAGWGKPKELEIIKPEEIKDDKKTSSLETTSPKPVATNIQPSIAN